MKKFGYMKMMTDASIWHQTDQNWRRGEKIAKQTQDRLPPAAIPVAAPRASSRPTARKGAFGMDNISSVTMPAWYRIYKIEKYTITYLKLKTSN